MKLQGKRILITGGTSGVGLALVKALARCNQLIVVARDKEKLAALKASYPTVRTEHCDLANLDQLDAVCRNLLAEEEKVDVLLCNAAVQREPLFTDPDFRPDRIAAEVNTNFSSVALLVARLLPKLCSADGGSIIVFVNSSLAISPKRSSAVYCATKAALRSLAQSLRYQLAGSGTRVAEAYLPLVETAMTAGRGTGKITAEAAATGIIDGIEKGRTENYIGKAKWVQRIHRASPALARHILMKL